MSKFFKELHRRNVIKATVAYLVACWLILQVLSIVLPSLNAPDWIMRASMLVMLIGLPVWIIISWIYDLTPEGLKKTDELDEEATVVAKTNKRLNFFILGALVGVAAVLIFKPVGNLVKTDDGKYAIAVLPFENMGASGDDAWFGDGVTEDILTNLSQFEDLRVISRTSVNQYKNTEKTIPEIAEELGVYYVLEGSVRQSGEEILITAQLIDATDKHIWSDNYRKTNENVFDIQSDVSQQIVEQLKLTITPEQQQVIEKPLTSNQDALMLYIRGRELSDVQEQQGEVSFRRSIEVLKQAIELDPEFASAYAEIANSTFLLVAGNHMPLEEGEMEARKWIERALEIDPNNARAFSALGFINAFKFCAVSPEDAYFNKAKEYIERSIELNPNDHRVHQHYGLLHSCSRPDKKIHFKHQRIAIQLDPLSFLANTNYLRALRNNEMYDEAAALFEDKKFLFSEEPYKTYDYDAILSSWRAKDWTKGFEVWQEAVRENPENPSFRIQLASKYLSVMNDEDAALYQLKQAFELNKNDGYTIHHYIWDITGNGDIEEAEELLYDPGITKILEEQFGFGPHYLRSWLLYRKGEYVKAIAESEKFDFMDAPQTFRYLCYYKLENRQKADSILQHQISHPIFKLFAFGEVEERDSMYHHLNKLSFESAESIHMNNWWSLKKYIKEPRFQEFRKKNYLPVND